MIAESRTAKSIKNAKVALLFYFINLILQFFSRKIFLEYLGAEVLGLNTTAQNLLGFLNLAELGIGAAISFILYKPLFEKDTQAINEIVSVQGWLYRKIAWIVIGGACVLMCFFPWIFAKAELALGYAYGAFSVFLSSSLLSYFFNYRQIVLTADQKEYKITLNVQGFKILKIVLQVLAIHYLSNGYVWWLVLELLAACVVTIVLDRVLKSEYPWLRPRPSLGKELRKKYSNIIIKTKQLFFHKISYFVLEQVSPLIIYAYTSLSVVAIYGNYMLIMLGVTLLLSALFNSIHASIGNLVAEGNLNSIFSIFEELFSSRFLFSATICVGVWFLTPSFVTLWLGKEYVLDSVSFLILVAVLYISLMRTVDGAFLNAYGLYQDVWATITEAALNLGVSILFGYFWGLPGILGGSLLSLFLMVFLWKPYFLFKKGFVLPFRKYCFLYVKYIVCGLVSFVAVLPLASYLPLNPTGSYIHLVLYGLLVTGSFGGILFCLLYLSDRGMKKFVFRIFGICRRSGYK